MKLRTLLSLTSLSLCLSVPSYSQGFTDVSAAAGVAFNHDGIAEGVDMPFGTGAAWIDFNRDGNIDLYVTNRESANKLFRNNGDGTFTDVAVSLGAADAGGDGAGVGIGDINNDGYPDIYLANGDEDVLLKNNNGTSFTDISASAGIGLSGNSRGTSATFGDYDNDGFIDLYVSHHVPVIGATGGSTQDYFFHNNGDETFTDVSSLLGLTNLMDPGFIAGWTDYDHDSDLDLILINDCPFNTDFENDGTQVFRNDGGTNGISDWTFTEVGSSIIENDCSNGMGIGIGDYNRDGWLDVVYSNVGPANLFKNNNGVFEEVSDVAGIDIQDSQHFSWGTSFFDYNNDGWQDIIMSVGALSLGVGDETQECNLFHNNGNGTFTDFAAVLGLDDDARTRNIIHADYDNDGDLDLFLINYNAHVTLLRNDVITTNNFLRIFLSGTSSNADALGAKIEVETPDGVTQHFEMRSGSNLGGGDEVCAHFGLGANNSIVSVKITWPSGIVQMLDAAAINTTYSVSELAPLPVEMSSFSARALEEYVMLDWSTASETDNAYFEVERSDDGRVFQSIGKVAGQGTSAFASAYTFIDQNPIVGTNYYRIKQVDWDEKSTVSETKVVTFAGAKPSISIFPNPVTAVTDQFTVQFKGYPLDGTLEVFDVYGKRMHQQQLSAVQNTTLTVEVGDWANGLYLVSVSGQAAQRLVLNR